MYRKITDFLEQGKKVNIANLLYYRGRDRWVRHIQFWNLVEHTMTM